MYSFILQLFIMFSFGTIVYLAARTLPRISDTETEIKHKTKSNWKGFLYLEKVDMIINKFLEKNLRKTKLILMKMDNLVNEQLNRFKKNREGKK